MVSNRAIITKVYFPRLVLPLSAILTNLVDFFVASLVLVGLMVYYGFAPHLEHLLILPLLLVMTFFAALGAGLFLAAINVKYRDVRYVLPYFIQMALFVTPVIYPSSLAGKYSWILAINPLTGIIKAARGALLGTEPINWLLLGISAIAISITLVVGVYVFKKTEGYFADLA
jgi:lipopolysaccharide transport system permease protein